jgi:hypothetical protein
MFQEFTLKEQTAQEFTAEESRKYRSKMLNRKSIFDFELDFISGLNIIADSRLTLIVFHT